MAAKRLAHGEGRDYVHDGSWGFFDRFLIFPACFRARVRPLLFLAPPPFRTEPTPYSTISVNLRNCSTRTSAPGKIKGRLQIPVTGNRPEHLERARTQERK
jgi:hypothetical protein